MDPHWSWVVAVLCLSLSTGSGLERFILTEIQPTGPKMCRTKCELNSNCNHFEFDSHTLKCLLYGGGRENRNGGSGNKIQPMGTALMNLPKNLQKLVNECRIENHDKNTECFVNRKNNFRCAESGEVVYDCGQCTSPRKRNRNYKKCRCKLGCSKKIRGQKATCHRKCEIYGKTFTKTSGIGIQSYNTRTTNSWIEPCGKQCVKERAFECLSYESFSRGMKKTCYLQNVSWLDVAPAVRLADDPGWGFFHRDCA